MQRTNADRLTPANVGDHIAYSVLVARNFRTGPAHTQSGSGTLTSVSVMKRIGVLRATIDGVDHTVGPDVIVEITRAPGASPMTLPAPRGRHVPRYTKSRERLTSEVKADLFGVTTSRPADAVTRSHVGQEIEFDFAGADFTGVVTAVKPAPGDMVEIVVDDQSFVLPGDKVVTLTKRRLPVAS